MITSSQNSKVKLTRSLLGRPKERREAGAFLVEGVRLVEEAAAARWPLRFVLHSPDLSPRAQTLANALRGQGIETDAVDPAILLTLSDTETPQGILAVAELNPLPLPAKPTFLLIPDAIRDPGNLGTLLRTAAAAGVEGVLIPPETTDPFAPKVVRSGMGAHFRLPIVSLDWAAMAARLDGLAVFVAEMEGSLPLWEADFTQPMALVVGGEAEGASTPARQRT
ncbi:MAG: RNA methyltransferase, partial [Anaerolineales bacterium]